MKIIDAIHLAFDYVRTDENDKVVETYRALSDVNIEIEEGSFVCVLGHNGSGKSTFAKLINGLNLPTEGTMLVGGKDTKNEQEIWDIRKNTGMVFQNPDNQIIASIVEEDVGFGPENIGVPTEEIWERVDRSLKAVGMLPYRLKSPNRLSGGQKQRVAIAGTMAMKPRCIVLDEPTAMLDPNGRKEVIKTIHELNRREGITIVLITHYMEETIDADRIIVMDNGSVLMDGTPREIFSQVEVLKAHRMDVPQVTELAWELKKHGMALSDGILSRAQLIQELRGLLAKKDTDMQYGEMASNTNAGMRTSGQQPSSASEAEGERTSAPDTTGEDTALASEPLTSEQIHGADPVMRVKHLTHIYQPGTAMESYALRDISFEIVRGSFTGLIGHTGSGKSTLIQHLNGLVKASSGSIEVNFLDDAGKPQGFSDINGEHFDMKQLRFRVGLVFQYPEYQLFEVDVLSDVMFGPKNQGLSEEAAKERAEEALRLVGLKEKHWHKSPFELSGGQKRRVAIAGVLAMQPQVLILDEPTAGLDPKGRDDILGQIDQLHREKGITIILVSHSMEDIAAYADQVLVLDHGELQFSGTPEAIFKNYKALEGMGLAAPQMTYLVHELREVGIYIDDEADTVKKVRDALLELYRCGEGKRNENGGAGLC